MASSSNNSANSASFPQRLSNPPRIVNRPRFCRHGLTSFRTSHTPQNPERRYYCCSRRGSADDCGMWLWLDDEISEYYKLCWARQKQDLERAQEQLQHARLMESLNREKFDLRVNEFNAAKQSVVELQSMNEALQATIDSLQAVVDAQKFQIRVLKWAFAFGAFMFAYLLKIM